MDESHHGIVLRTRPLTETSVIVHWLTPGPGRLATVAKGARRPKSPFRGKLDLFYEAQFSFARGRSELHTLREVVVTDTHSRIREELGWIQQASYFASFIEHATETDTPLPDIHELMSDVLKRLCDCPAQPRTVFAFELKMLDRLGLQPDLTQAVLAPGTRQIAQTLSAADWDTIGRLRLSQEQAVQLRSFLHGFLIYHLGNLPRGRAAAVQSGN
jgi:DNA repair protein RecO (recombination protein O)